MDASFYRKPAMQNSSDFYLLFQSVLQALHLLFPNEASEFQVTHLEKLLRSIKNIKCCSQKKKKKKMEQQILSALSNHRDAVNHFFI